MAFYIEFVAVVVHCIYGIIRWAYEQGGNINEELAVPVLTFLYWTVGILYLASLLAALLFGRGHSVVAVIVFGMIGLAYAIMTFGLIVAILSVLLLIAIAVVCPALVPLLFI